MRLKLEWERYDNRYDVMVMRSKQLILSIFTVRFILIDMVKKEHKERGCACNGGDGTCSDPLPE